MVIKHQAVFKPIFFVDNRTKSFPCGMKETEMFTFRSLYELELMSVKPARGFYTISLSTVPQKADKRFIGTTGAEVRIRNI